MSAFAASSLSTPDMSFTRRFKPLPKRRRNSVRRVEMGGHHSKTDPPLVSAYYHPISNGRVGRLKQESNVTPCRSRSPNKLAPFSTRSRIVEDADGEGDYTDHLQQPNNTKKRKVPAATAAFARGPTLTRENDDLIDEYSCQESQINLPGKIVDDAGASQSPQEFNYQPIIARRKPASLVTLATLRLKDLLRARRRMMATAIGDGMDPLALELALSTPFTRPPTRSPIRAWSYGPRFRRQPRNHAATLLNREPCFSRNFTFSFPSPIGKRYTIAKKVAAGLRLRFQTELTHQATTNFEVALKSTSKSSYISGSEKKRTHSSPVGAPSNTTSVEKASKKPNKSKKKKRSTLANASNPHHLRNYVPSRVSHAGSHQASSGHGQASNSLGPLALKFLSATLPPRTKGRAPTGESSGSSLIPPDTEWICPFCEYSLFYGDEAAMQRAARNRRRILTRRRNARERAAAAASGAMGPRNQDTSDDEGESEDESEDDEDSFGEGSDISLHREAGTIGARQDNRCPHPGG
ncbi:unnamed protein product [Rhizoctonia solani]|uniref:Uncharacterized protein n=1 Tax=Rhizoctonia solani TaxID=456999 RepID=A0A8H3HXY9_9AGAM|nr:unnamed protein product [Rhizoctonia solani]